MEWRNDSTHLVVVTTDAPFHSALDGKIAGLLEPFDMKCHMEVSGSTSFHQDFMNCITRRFCVVQGEFWKLSKIAALNMKQTFESIHALKQSSFFKFLCAVLYLAMINKLILFRSRKTMIMYGNTPRIRNWIIHL